MSDQFKAIASNEIKSRIPLKAVLPKEDNGKRFLMISHDRLKTCPVYKKMDSKSELDEEIAKLGDKFAPYLLNIYRKDNPKSRKYISQFDYRIQTEEDKRNFLSVLSGKGEWKNISIPQYSSNIGNVTEYYRTVFYTSRLLADETLWLCFDGVDYKASVYVNGNLVGTHEGFFSHFEFDISKYLNPRKNTLLIVVENDYPYNGHSAPLEGVTYEGDKMYAATGPGSDDPELGWHHCPPGMGIFQDVYIEHRPSFFISDLYVRPLENDDCEVWCELYNCEYRPKEDVELEISVRGDNFDSRSQKVRFKPVTFRECADGRTLSEDLLNDEEMMKKAQTLKFFKGENLVRFRMHIKNAKHWDLDTPYLYRVTVKLICEESELEKKSITFGMRTFEQKEENGKKGMYFLNGRSLRLRGANTMGFEQQDVMNRDYDKLYKDLLMAKAANMNFLRLTQRPVQKEIYEMCDRIGLMIQTDLPLFTNVRRTKFAEVIRQAEEMEKLVRTHPSVIQVSYLNEPFPNASGKPHRHFIREELEDLFVACDKAVKLLNPERVIKHIDGDYDPPSTDLPDYHTYTMWYNGHGIEFGKMYRGYWLDLPENSYCGCGEFGAEGLDPEDLMNRRYLKKWLPVPGKEKEWTPSEILGAQSGSMYSFFFDRQDNLGDWVEASREYQREATRLQTESFRRNDLMVSYAIHLFIDAWPAGWMKTIVDCERNPKPAFFAYRDACTPLMVSLRSDRITYFSGEQPEFQVWVCNDTHTVYPESKLIFEITDESGKLLYWSSADAEYGENSVFLQGKLVVPFVKTDERKKLNCRCILTDSKGKAIHYTDESFEVFPVEEEQKEKALFIDGKDFIEHKKKYEEIAEKGRTVVVSGLEPGEYEIANSKVKVKACGMRPLNFVSRKTGHELVKGFGKNDFRFWYDEKKDMITPIIYSTLVCDEFNPILLSGNCDKGSAWQNPVHQVTACAEKKYGKGKIVLNQVDLDNHLINPVAKIFKNRLNNY